MSARYGVRLAGALAFALLATPLGAQVSCGGKDYELQLKRRWVESIAHRTTISGTMDIRHFKKSINRIASGGDDGDIHFSGESPEVGLPFVAEIVNAATARATVSALRAATPGTVPIEGAWRVWFEHPPTRQTQGAANPFHPAHTNPDHSFEIHPVSQIDAHDLRATWRMIPGYEAYEAEKAFPFFDACRISVRGTRSGITIRSKKLKYNYVEFDAILVEAPKRVRDGYFVRVIVGPSDDERQAESYPRLVVVAGTEAADEIGRAEAGDAFRVLAIPRLDLSAVLGTLKGKGAREFDMALPYELIVVGVR